MSYKGRPTLTMGLRIVVLLAACSLALEAAAPRGWFVAGSKPTEYESGIDTVAAYNGHPSAYLKAKVSSVEGFGTLMQDFRADHYLGKRVRFSAFVKTERAQDWAGLWMRVDKESKQLAFDNMQDRSIKGTTDWKQYDVVLDVPQDATGIFFGVLLSGTGTVWLSEAKFEIVSPNVLTTNRGCSRGRTEARQEGRRIDRLGVPSRFGRRCRPGWPRARHAMEAVSMPSARSF